MKLATSIAQIRALGPCATGYRFAFSSFPKDGEVSAAAAREAGCSFEDMAWYLSIQAQANPEIDRRFRHWKADVAAHVLHLFEAAFPLDLRPREAIIAAHEVAEAFDPGDRIARTSDAAQVAENMAFDAGKERAGQAAAAARVCGESRASWVVSRCAVEAAWGNRAAELAWQYDRLIAWFTGDGPGPLELSK